LPTQDDSAPESSRFLLHHYEASPYAEKIRAMFGLADAPWSSVLSPPYPPRPAVDPLAGGYRRIPVGQIGADIFCDTALIAAEVARATGHPEFAPAVADPDAQALVERAEGDVFFSAITSANPLKLLGKLILANGPRGTMNFVRDRTAMMKTASVRPPQGKEAARLFEAFLADLDDHLANRGGLEGAEPTYADFSAYHPIWLAKSVGSSAVIRNYGHVQRWFDRMQSLGQGQRREATAEEAFNAAEQNSPRGLVPAEVEHEWLGKEVTIAPSDYGQIGVRGTLVAVLEDRQVLRRQTERFGELHVHFPRAGYAIAIRA
jgi:glutathione S-transferase